MRAKGSSSGSRVGSRRSAPQATSNARICRRARRRVNAPISPVSRTLQAAIGVWLLHTDLVIAGTVTGKVDLVEKGGRKATDLSDVVIYVEGAKVKPRPATASVVMKGKSFLPHLVVVP